MSGSHPIAPNRPDGLCSRLRRRTRRGFTLVETMIATMVFTMGILGVYAMMIKSYDMVTLARHRDNSRALLLSFADQFLRLQTTDGTPPVTRPFFVPNVTPDAAGLSWTDSGGNPGLVDGFGLHVKLGDSGDITKGSQVDATVLRSVTLLDSTSGAPVGGTTPTYTAAGYMLQATFTITYRITGLSLSQSQSVTVARRVP